MHQIYFTLKSKRLYVNPLNGKTYKFHINLATSSVDDEFVVFNIRVIS